MMEARLIVLILYYLHLRRRARVLPFLVFSVHSSIEFTHSSQFQNTYCQYLQEYISCLYHDWNFTHLGVRMMMILSSSCEQ